LLEPRKEYIHEGFLLIAITDNSDTRFKSGLALAYFPYKEINEPGYSFNLVRGHVT
jgi:hypothetical protein